jgi:hypothetical protein
MWHVRDAGAGPRRPNSMSNVSDSPDAWSLHPLPQIRHGHRLSAPTSPVPKQSSARAYPKSAQTQAFNMRCTKGNWVHGHNTLI